MKALQFIVLFLLPLLVFPQHQGKLVTLQLPNPCASITHVVSPALQWPELMAYPNPTSGLLTLALSDIVTCSHKTIKVFSPAGVHLYSFSWDGAGETTIDTSGWPAGIYILKVSGTKLKVVQWVMKI